MAAAGRDCSPEVWCSFPSSSFLTTQRNLRRSSWCSFLPFFLLLLLLTTHFNPVNWEQTLLFRCRFPKMCTYVQGYTSNQRHTSAFPQNIITLKRPFSFPWVLVNLIMSKMSPRRPISLEEVWIESECHLGLQLYHQCLGTSLLHQ